MTKTTLLCIILDHCRKNKNLQPSSSEKCHFWPKIVKKKVGNTGNTVIYLSNNLNILSKWCSPFFFPGVTVCVLNRIFCDVVVGCRIISKIFCVCATIANEMMLLTAIIRGGHQQWGPKTCDQRHHRW